ncbi:MAG: hypothetical protein QME42_06545 [bacterium]|nr:hypothetical protein [bacterium]
MRIDYDDLKKELNPDLKELLGIELDEIIKLEINPGKITEKITSFNNTKNELLQLLNMHYEENNKEDMPKNLYRELAEKQELRKDVQSQVDEPFKKYQKYLEELNEWKNLFRDKNSTKKELKRELQYVKNELPKSLKCEKQHREILIRNLFDSLKQKVTIYETLYEPVIKFIQQERDKNPYMELNFSAQIMLSSDFNSRFLSFIDRGRKGSFHGIEESQDLLKELIQKYDFANIDEIIKFLNEIISKLQNETVNGQEIPRVIENQLVQDKTKDDLYAFLYLLEFLKIDYRLKWGDKLLEDLSPGERGTVLLIFYLLIDKSDVPLVIDQPEENLDNESIYYLLVRYMKQAKSKRQIFIVTHNPNLAVVCDAEQVIYCDIDKKNKYKVSYETGSIENRIIKQKIIDVLEGTKPAFNNRQNKYEL